jgi:hypothetical protein
MESKCPMLCASRHSLPKQLERSALCPEASWLEKVWTPLDKVSFIFFIEIVHFHLLPCIAWLHRGADDPCRVRHCCWCVSGQVVLLLLHQHKVSPLFSYRYGEAGSFPLSFGLSVGLFPLKFFYLRILLPAGLRRVLRRHLGPLLAVCCLA